MKMNWKQLLQITAIGLVGMFPSMVVAETAEEKGRNIMVELVKRDNGFGDTKVNLEMILTNQQGQTSTRQMKNRILEVPGDGDKQLIIFDQPRDVKGTAMLTFTHIEGDDDQWLYLPALKRVKRISSRNKSGSFMGSEFAYEDLVSQEVEKYKDYKYLRDEDCGDGLKCFVVERVPTDKNSGYRRQVAWIDQEHYRPIKMEYYDRKNSHLKTQYFRKYEKFLDKYWRSAEMEMVNVQSGKKTVLQFKNYEFRNGFSERDFDRKSLKRAR